MRRSRFAESQIVSNLKGADVGYPVNQFWRSYGINSGTYYMRKAKYSGLKDSDMKRLKELEHKNGRLKQMRANLLLENAAMKDLIEKSSEAR